MRVCEACNRPLAAERFWTETEIAKSLRLWQGLHGSPPSAFEWRRAGYEHPSEATVRLRFGTWNAGLSAAGLPVRRRGGPRGRR